MATSRISSTFAYILIEAKINVLDQHVNAMLPYDVLNYPTQIMFLL